jgi:hypothetical protein
MAEQTSAVYHRGDMPVAEHASTYKGVMGLFKWGALGAADLLILLVMAFCTPAGFFPALVVAVIVLIAGIVGLRGSKAPAAH